MTRKNTGFVLTLSALILLIILYLSAITLYWTGNGKQMLLSIILTLPPLIYFLPSTWQRRNKTYAALALLAPLHLFLGGVIWLWGHVYWGIAITLCVRINRVVYTFPFCMDA
ncbi:MAG: hypothetical protein Q4A74_06495, partial [Cardiobacteriaceae bacterium]|nr:hypothetical protein [Cardiobacteriaceae bacterium]